MTRIAFKHWQQFVAVALLALSLGMGSAHAAAFDINTASATEIEKNLDGIGPVKAKAIVKHRGKNGKFKDTDDLLNVDGIGPATVKKNFSALGLKRGKTPLKAGVSSKTKSKISSSSKSKTSTNAKSISSKTKTSTKVSAKAKPEAKTTTTAKKDSTTK